MPRITTFLVAATFLLLPRIAVGQGLVGALIGTVRDAEGGVLSSAIVRVSSPALIGGAIAQTTNEKGQLRFLALPPGRYALDVESQGFASYHEEDIRIGAGGTLSRAIVLQQAGFAESIVVEGAGSHIDARNPGLGARFTSEDLTVIPMRRASMFDFMRAAPGISPTSPTSATTTTVSAFGSGTNENQFLFDGTNFTCPCNGVSRAEPGVDFIEEIQIQSVGASAEYGNVQGAVINVITKQGGARFQSDVSYYGQPSSLTSQPVLRPLTGSTEQTGYERVRYRDLTTNLGGPVVRDRLWFFTGYQYLRDYDSQPGTDPAFPRTYEQNKIFTKLTWKLTPRLQLEQSVHYEYWVNPEQPTSVKPFDTTLRTHASVPAMTFGHLTHTLSPNTLWDLRVGRFVHARVNDPSTGNRTTVSRFDRATGVTSGGPPEIGGLTLIRTTGKATVTHFEPGVFGVDHEWKIGTQIERGEGRGPSVIPTGVKYVDNNGQPFQAISSAPSHTGGQFVTLSAFASDGITFGDRLTINAGLRFDHNRAISQDLHAIDAEGRETDEMIHGLGTLYTWDLFSPRLGATVRLSADGRTMLRGSYGRFSSGVLTGEFSGVHPAVNPTTTTAFDPDTGGYTRIVRVVDPRINLLIDPETRAPHTDEYSIGVDRELGRRLAVSLAYVHKDGKDFIGWTDVGGQYALESRTLADGRTLPVFVLVNSTADQRFLLTNPHGYSMTYNGLVMVAEKRSSHGVQVLGSYTYSRSIGLLASSGATAAGAQASTVAQPTTAFGFDPNDLTNNTHGRLPNDRPHMLRAMGSLDLARTGVIVSANFQYFSGKPWAATAQVLLPQGDQRILLEPRGSRRLSSQTLLDLRVSKAIDMRGLGHVEIGLDVLNALNSSAEEGLATDNFFSPNFGQPTVFVDPRRAMISLRVNIDR